jgi:acetyl-CoA acetyltransferase
MRGLRSPPQQRLDPREQLLAAEGLDDVVVGAGAEAPHLVDLAAARGEQDHRNVAQVAQALERLESIELRHREIHDDEVRRVRVERAERSATVLSGLDAVSSPAQELRKQQADVVVVVDNEHPTQGCLLHGGLSICDAAVDE